MQVIGTDNKTYKLKLVAKATHHNDLRKKSDNHKFARSLLIELFPYDQLHEEVTLPGCSTSLYLDFFYTQKRLALEVQGEQHKKFIPYFHGTVENFLKQRKRDAEKKLWCEQNSIKLVELYDNERNKWREQILDWSTKRESE